MNSYREYKLISNWPLTADWTLHRTIPLLTQLQWVKLQFRHSCKKIRNCHKVCVKCQTFAGGSYFIYEINSRFCEIISHCWKSDMKNSFRRNESARVLVAANSTRHLLNQPHIPTKRNSMIKIRNIVELQNISIRNITLHKSVEHTSNVELSLEFL